MITRWIFKGGGVKSHNLVLRKNSAIGGNVDHMLQRY